MADLLPEKYLEPNKEIGPTTDLNRRGRGRLNNQRARAYKKNTRPRTRTPTQTINTLRSSSRQKSLRQRTTRHMGHRRNKTLQRKRERQDS